MRRLWLLAVAIAALARAQLGPPGEPQQVSWAPDVGSRQLYPANQVYPTHDRAADSLEYYDDEYYDEGQGQQPEQPQQQQQPADRQPKAAQPSANASAHDEESYYYDDDDYIEEDPKSGEPKPNPHSPTKPDDSDGDVADETQPALKEQAVSEGPAVVGPSSEKPPEDGNDESAVAVASSEAKDEPSTSEAPSEQSDDSILIGEAIVSVVTTKSVVNGTFSVPETTTALPLPTSTSTAEQDSIEPTISSSSTSTTTEGTTSTSSSTTTTTTTTTTTEVSVPSSTTIQASVQTSRSISGARFLPFPSVVDNNKPEQLDSTESINDKLDRVQSELSSGFLSNGRFVPRRYNKKPFSATSLNLPTSSTTVAPTSSPIAPITITSITKRPRVGTTIDDIAALLPRDFAKGLAYRPSTGSTTKRPKLQTTLDDIEAFLPKDFPGRGGAGYRTSTSTTGSPTTTTTSTTTKRPKFQTTLDDVEAFLPKDFPKSYRSGGYGKRPGYKTTSTTPASSLAASTDRSKASTRPKTLTTIEDIGAFLPPGYRLRKEDATTERSVTLSEALAKIKPSREGTTVSTSTTTTERTRSIQDLFAKSNVDISALLPPGFKLEASSPKPNNTRENENPLEKLFEKPPSIDISALLPSGYKPEPAQQDDEPAKSDLVQELLAKTKLDASLLPAGFDASTQLSAEAPTTKSPGAAAGLKIVFPSRPGGRKPILNRNTSPSSKAAGSAGESTPPPRIQKGWPTRATTEFTGWPTSSTTPISIEKLLEAARTATVSSANVSHVPTTSEQSSTPPSTTSTTTTLRPTTPGICDEGCDVAGTIKIVENALWLPELLDRNTREWQDLAEEIEREMNLVFAKSPVLRKWYRNIRIDSFSQGSVLVDYFVELADLKEKINTQQLKVIFHDSLRTFNFDDPMEIGSMRGPMKLGKFTIDPKSTDFVVIPKVAAPKMSEDDNKLIPQWAIAMIVIGVGGLLFTIIFGVSVLVNRQHGSKLKPSITAMFEEEAAKNAMSHSSPPSRPASSDYQKTSHATMWTDAGWHDKPFESTSHKILVDGLPYERKYNMYDSWKSEWNGYYYNPTQASGSNFSRHHPDYDMNF